jgi:hypothetical protein
MRDFCDAKSMAQTIRAGLAAKGVKITVSESLELIAKAFGAADWNTLSALIKAAGEAPQRPAAALPLADSDRALDRLAKGLGVSDWDELTSAGAGDVGFSPDLQATLHRAVEAAGAQRQEYTTLEHVLAALIDDPDAAAVMKACQVDPGALKVTLGSYIDGELKGLAGREGPGQQEPTAGFLRVMQRAVSHVRAARAGPVTGANVLVAIFSEEESHAAHSLRQQGMKRIDGINFVAFGIRKTNRAA